MQHSNLLHNVALWFCPRSADSAAAGLAALSTMMLALEIDKDFTVQVRSVRGTMDSGTPNFPKGIKAISNKAMNGKKGGQEKQHVCSQDAKQQVYG